MKPDQTTPPEQAPAPDQTNVGGCQQELVRLSGWRDLGGHLAGLIAAEMDSMTDQQLQELGAIHKHADETNCWYVVLGIAPAIATLAHQMLEIRRKSNTGAQASAHPKDPQP